MTIYGPQPLENQSAAEEYGVATLFLKQRIAARLAKFRNLGVAEPGVMGCVVALRVLAEARGSGSRRSWRSRAPNRRTRRRSAPCGRP